MGDDLVIATYHDAVAVFQAHTLRLAPISHIVDPRLAFSIWAALVSSSTFAAIMMSSVIQQR